MGSMKEFVSNLGFSIRIPDSWVRNENSEIVDLPNKEWDRQKKWIEIGKEIESEEKIARLFTESMSGLSTGLQCIELFGRKVFYEVLLSECAKDSARSRTLDEGSAALARFLLTAQSATSQNWKIISGTTLLIELQKMTDGDRLRAKEELRSQLGYVIIGDNKNSDDFNITIFKFGMKSMRRPLELYSIYKQSLPVWFWSGVPDKVKTLKNQTVDGGEIVLVESYLESTAPDSINAYAVNGTIGWVISCTKPNSPKYKGIFNKVIDSFRVHDAGPSNFQPMYSCPNCNQAVSYGVRFCQNCGIQLNWPTHT